MGDLIDLNEHRKKKQDIEFEEAKQELQKLQNELKDLIGDLEEFSHSPLYDSGYDALIESFYRVDLAIDGYAEYFGQPLDHLENRDLIVSQSLSYEDIDS